MLPIDSKLIHCRWTGESTWIPFGDFRPGLDYENHTSHPAPGQLAIYPGGISECEIFFPYGGCTPASKVGQLAANHFAPSCPTTAGTTACARSAGAACGKAPSRSGSPRSSEALSPGAPGASPPAAVARGAGLCHPRRPAGSPADGRYARSMRRCRPGSSMHRGCISTATATAGAGRVRRILRLGMQPSACRIRDRCRAQDRAYRTAPKILPYGSICRDADRRTPISRSSSSSSPPSSGVRTLVARAMADAPLTPGRVRRLQRPLRRGPADADRAGAPGRDAADDDVALRPRAARPWATRTAQRSPPIGARTGSR